ncbi:MAG: hypothetical protein FWB86_00690 [Treponema sp.]|nr:hypothetical protein [Treponema sp.]MCL2250612.1 hypothetical protein [Treponema sp.]
MIIKKIAFIIIILSVFCCCNNKKIQESDNKNESNNNTDILIQNDNKIYVGPYYGALLYLAPSVDSTEIILLPQKTELTIIESSFEQDIVNNLIDYWYKIDTGKET